MKQEDIIRYSEVVRRALRRRPDLAPLVTGDIITETIAVVRERDLSNTRDAELNAYDPDYHTVPIPIEEFIEDRHYVGDWYVEKLFDCWKKEICDVINKGAVEWVLCLQGDTPIPLLDGSVLPIKEMATKWESNPKPFDVFSRNDEGRIVSGIATDVRCTGEDEIFRVLLNDGTYVEANARHQFVDSKGTKRMVSDLVPGDSLAPYGKDMSHRKVIGVESTGRVEPVYCMTVDQEHNFAVLSRWVENRRIAPVNGIISSNTGSIGAGKTSVAMLCQLYKLYVLTCMRNPCGFYSSTSITFGMFSIAKYLAYDVEATMLMKRVRESEYFMDAVGISEERDNPRLPRSLVLRFPNDIKFVFGASQIHSLGQDLFGGIMDEVAFSNSPGAKQVRQLYDSVKDRIESRFMTEHGRLPGILCIASSANTEGDFLDDHLKSAVFKDKIHVSRFSIYQVKSYPGVRFRVLVGDKLHSSRLLDEVYTDVDGSKKVRPLQGAADVPEGVKIEEVPYQFYQRFTDNIEMALRNISGVPLFSTQPFFPTREKLYEAIELYERSGHAMGHPFSVESPVISLEDDDLTLETVFLKDRMFVEVDRFRNKWRPRVSPGVPRFIHADLAKNHDSAGIACCHLFGFRPLVRADDTGKEEEIQVPVVYVDFVIRIRPPKSSEIDFTKITAFILSLQNMGLPMSMITADQYQSTMMLQVMKRKGIETGQVSMDRNPEAYNSLKSDINAGCVLYYRYQPLLDELTQLQRVLSERNVVKIDHLLNGSKDCSDALAGCHYALLKSAYVKEQLQAIGPQEQRVKPPEGRPQDVLTSDPDWLYKDTGIAGRITDIRDVYH